MAQPPQPPHRVLPLDAILRLQRAARVTNTATDRFARQKAIDEAIAKNRHLYPHLFK